MGSITFWGVSPWLLSLWYARELLHQSVSLSHSLIILNLSISFLSSATFLNLPWAAVDSGTSCSRRPNSHTLGQGLQLGRHSLYGESCLVETMAKLWSWRLRIDNEEGQYFYCTSYYTCCCSLLWVLCTYCILLSALVVHFQKLFLRQGYGY